MVDGGRRRQPRLPAAERIPPGRRVATRTLHISSDVPDFLYGRDWLGNVRIGRGPALSRLVL